jgi:hypothetical protein
MMISLVELLKVLNLFIIQGLELYCIEKCNEMFYRSLTEARNDSYDEYVLATPVVEVEVEEKEVLTSTYTSSKIEGTGAEKLLESLKVELDEVDDNEAILLDEAEAFDYSLIEPPVNFHEEDCLTVNDLYEVGEVEIDEQYTELANAKIQDELRGKQQWTVNVIGLEKNYIHVSDGIRIWLDIGNYASKVSIGDVLSVEVDRQIDRVEVLDISVLHQVSEDYMIIDEMDEFLFSARKPEVAC